VWKEVAVLAAVFSLGALLLLHIIPVPTGWQ
jgi:hypothetical protein